jgi:hypothetical protein
MRTPVDEPADEFREAVRRLHRAKDAAYRDAWKRRGEVLSILASIARKADRLEYGQDGAPATAGETRADTAVDLLVYCLKCQAYLAGLDAGTAGGLFGGSGVRPPCSDGPAGFEALLARADLAPFTSPRQPAGEAARRVVSRFAELEACFRDTSSMQPVSVRPGRLAALTDAATALIGALRREHAQAYARFAAACLAMEGGTADAR